MNKYRIAKTMLNSCSGHDAGRQLLAQLYREETGKTCPEIGFSPSGKPYFLSSPLEFSITHTPRHAFCVLWDRPVGIDAEETDRTVKFSVARRCLSPTEYARWETSEDPQAALLRLWVLKEAWAKFTGRGLGNWIQDTDFSPDDPRISLIDGCYVAVITE